jgi:hypothetical protein
MVPIVALDQIYSFDRDALIKALPAPKGAKARDFGAAAAELFDRIMLLADNAGSPMSIALLIIWRSVIPLSTTRWPMLSSAILR